MRLALDWLRKYQMQIAAAVVYFGFFGGCLIFGFAYTGSAIVRSDGPRIAFGIILTVLCAYMVMAGVEGIVQFVIRNRERTHAVDGRGRPLVPTAAD